MALSEMSEPKRGGQQVNIVILSILPCCKRLAQSAAVAEGSSFVTADNLARLPKGYQPMPLAASIGHMTLAMCVSESPRSRVSGPPV